MRKLLFVALVVAIFAGPYLYYQVSSSPDEPLPSEETVRKLLRSNAMPGVVDREGHALPSRDDTVRFDGIFPLSWGAVAVYHTDEMQGWTVLTRSVDGWAEEGGSWGPISSAKSSATTRWDKNRLAGFDDEGLRYADLVIGQVTDPQAHTMSVRYDDGQTISQQLSDGRFAIVAEEHGAACELLVLDGTQQVLERVPFEADPIPVIGADEARYDCQP